MRLPSTVGIHGGTLAPPRLGDRHRIQVLPRENLDSMPISHDPNSHPFRTCGSTIGLLLFLVESRLCDIDCPSGNSGQVIYMAGSR